MTRPRKSVRATRRERPRRSGWIANLLLLAVTLGSTLAAMDYAVFRLFHADPGRVPSGLYAADSARGFRLSPGFVGRVATTVPFDVSVNAEGYRDRPWTADRPFRVLVAGDSFTFGFAAPYEDGFVYRAEQALGDRARTYNAGVGGYGVPHVLETVRRECPKVRPRHVVYAYFLNDTRWDNMRLDYALVIDGELVPTYDRATQKKMSSDDILERLEQAREAPPPKWLAHNPLALHNIRRYLSERNVHPRQLAERLFGGQATSDYLARYTVSDDPDLYTPQATVAAARMIGRMRQAAETCGAGFTLLILPGHAEGYYGIEEPATERLLAALDGWGLDILDLRADVEPGTVLALVGDGHYNKAAAAWVGQRLAEHLRALYPDDPAPGPSAPPTPR